MFVDIPLYIVKLCDILFLLMKEMEFFMYIISKCLLGENCKYNGGNNRNQEILDFCKTHEYIAVCPEGAANLPIPREPAERVGSKILNRSGQDLTDSFLEGARLSLEKALKVSKQKKQPIEGAVLKANSPSCGCNKIYDGTFSGTLTDGDGCFVQLLKAHGIPVYTEKNFSDNI